MIRVDYDGKTYAPHFYCDICHQPITDARRGAAVSPIGMAIPDGHARLDVLHVHKGKCQDAAEDRVGGRANAGWDELIDHVRHLARNTGLTPESLADRQRTFDDTGI
jgi:hypothetical protein